jgi:hypothetical protein
VPVARAVSWALPEHEVPTDLVLIDVDWNGAELAAGRSLLSRVHDLAAAHGADALSHHVDSPPGRRSTRSTRPPEFASSPNPERLRGAAPTAGEVAG